MAAGKVVLASARPVPQVNGYLRFLTPRHLVLVVTIADETLQHGELLEPSTAEELYGVGVATELMHERTVFAGSAECFANS